MQYRLALALVAPLLVGPLLVGAARAQSTGSWPQFLGPASATASGASSLRFDRDEDLRYRVEVPPGSSSPCIWGDRIFLTGRAGKELVMFALDRATGKELWRHGVPAPAPRPYDHDDGGTAKSTACTNGQRVFFYLPEYGIVARDFAGKLVWEKKLPEAKRPFGIGSSPALCGDQVILLRDGCPDRKLYALDEKTGDVTWEVQRLPFYESHSTPFVWKNRDRTEIVVASSGTVMGFAPDSGAQLWQVTGLTPLVCTTPTGDRDRLYFAGWSTPAAAAADRVLDGLVEAIELTEADLEDPKRLFGKFDKDGDGRITRAEAPRGRLYDAFNFLDKNRDGGVTFDEWVKSTQMPKFGENLVVAIRAGGEGDITKSHVEWTTRKPVPYVPSPVLHGGRLYIVKTGGILACLDPETGKPLYRPRRLGDHGEYYATPVAVDGHLVVCSDEGTLYVLDLGKELKQVRKLEFGESIHATPAVVGGVVYVRTEAALYAFGAAR